MRLEYDGGTYLDTGGAWDVYRGARVLCSDGRLRKVSRIAHSADTFFSIPATVKVKGKSISGFLSIDTDTEPKGTVRFTPVRYGRNYGVLPDWPRGQ